MGMNASHGEEMRRAGRYAIRFVPYDAEYCRRSYLWLTDPEIKRLTMTQEITMEAQQAWFDGLSQRADYYIRGIECNGEPIGAVGLKHIDVNQREAEYWGYIGSKKYIGVGIGKLMIEHIDEAANRFGLRRIYLQVARDNLRAYTLYRHRGFREYALKDGIVFMDKDVP